VLLVRYLVTAIGITHQKNVPDIPGLSIFRGQVTHSSTWTPDIRYENKRIAVIGSGASGVQLVSSLSEKANVLTHFIRHAQYVLPAAYRPVSKEERLLINQRYDNIWHDVFASSVGFGFPEPNRPTLSVSPEDREQIFQDLWDQGSGFRFLFGGFSDIATDEAANKEAIRFIHRKIKEIVKDPQKAEVLTSTDWFARRPLTDDKYYDRFNQDNVFAVDLRRLRSRQSPPRASRRSMERYTQ
jgi:cyclohexanone monooxygenase